jgi:hypothetical protein
MGRVISLSRLPSGAVLLGFGVDGHSSILGGGSGGGRGVSWSLMNCCFMGGSSFVIFHRPFDKTTLLLTL